MNVVEAQFDPVAEAWRARASAAVWPTLDRSTPSVEGLALLPLEITCMMIVNPPYSLQHASQCGANPCGAKASATCNARSPAASSGSGSGEAYHFSAFRFLACGGRLGQGGPSGS